MITTLRTLALIALLLILASAIAIYASATSYATPRHATCVRVERAHVGDLVVQIEGVC